MTILRILGIVYVIYFISCVSHSHNVFCSHTILPRLLPEPKHLLTNFMCSILSRVCVAREVLGVMLGFLLVAQIFMNFIICSASARDWFVVWTGACSSTHCHRFLICLKQRFGQQQKSAEWKEHSLVLAYQHLVAR